MIGNRAKRARSVSWSHLSRENWAWLAGLYEGEGWIGANRKWVQLKITSADLELLGRVYGMVGVGRITGPYTQEKYPNAKPYHDLTVAVSSDAYAIAMAIWPWLTSRRQEQIVKAVRPWLDGKDMRRRENRLIST